MVHTHHLPQQLGLLLLLLAVSPTIAGTDQQCSFAGRRVTTAAGPVACACEAPWQGARCNELPSPPELRTPTEYAAASQVHAGRPLVVAQCDTRGSANPDCTAELNAALASASGSTVFVPQLPGGLPWSARGLKFASSDLRIVFEDGAVVQAYKNESYIFGCDPIADFSVMHRRSNVTLVGYGATLRMWRDEYVARCKHSEFRMALAIQGCDHIAISGLTISYAGGDGLIVMGDGAKAGSAGSMAATIDLVLRDMIFDRNYRQGISVISVVNMLAENCTMMNTNGTSPAHGVDFEPDVPADRLANITFRRCSSINNQGAGFGFDFAGLTSTVHWAAGVPPVSLRFEDCTVIGNHVGWAFTTAYPSLAGSMVVVGGSTEGTASHGIGIYDKAASSLRVSFSDHSMRNVSTGGVHCTDVDPSKLCAFPDLGPKNSPVALFIRTGTPEREGNVSFSGLSVEDSWDRPWLQVLGDSNGWSGIALSNITVHNPHGCKADVSKVFGTHKVPTGLTPITGLPAVRCNGSPAPQPQPPPPSPSPSPPPPPSGCAAAEEKYCASAQKVSAAKCSECVAAHLVELSHGGCSDKDVQKFCHLPTSSRRAHETVLKTSDEAATVPKSADGNPSKCPLPNGTFAPCGPGNEQCSAHGKFTRSPAVPQYHLMDLSSHGGQGALPGRYDMRRCGEQDPNGPM